MLMGNNHACPVSQSVTTNTNDLLQGQRGLFLGRKVLKLSTGDMNNASASLSLQVMRGAYCIVVSFVSSDMWVQLKSEIIAGKVQWRAHC